MDIVDFHTHIYPNDIAEKATRNICNFYNLSTNMYGTSEELRKVGKKAGITKMVLLPVAVKPNHVQNINNFIAKESKLHNEFIGFGTIHADMDNPVKEVERIQNMGLKGIKLHPDTQCFATDDKRLNDVYEHLQGKLPVLIHCGDPRFDYSHPHRLKKLLNNFPKLTVIAAHLGGWGIFHTAFEYLKNEKCYLDISSTMMFLSPNMTKHYISAYGADRILFGSDFPLWNPEKELRTLLKLGLKPNDVEKIISLNAMRILE